MDDGSTDGTRDILRELDGTNGIRVFLQPVNQGIQSALDNGVLAESARLFTIARNTTARLARYNGIASEPLYHPPPLAEALKSGPLGDYVLSVGRLEATKRVDLIVRALAYVDRGVRLIVVGEGPLRAQLEE